MSEKKEANKAAKSAPAKKEKKAKIDPATKIKRDAKGKKVMKIARGTERARRRAGLVRDWRKTKGAASMLRAANEPEVEAAA